ncbi:MAG: nicotinate (nicotinamide) nucleotide adenylyltransferase [Clostridia bacterium]|nr:nicotinate (nicotinamide) nucleotide adenylyltransferase [Clostridia bacterium]
MNIGIFGGCFNPPHQMHFNICKELIDGKVVDKVIIVPTGDAYQKNELESAKHRYNMLKILLAGEDKIEVSTYEFKQEQIYTYQTLKYFSENYKNDEIFFICGADNLKQIKTWKNYKHILSNYKIIVIKRNDDYIADVLDELKDIKTNIIVSNIKKVSISSSNIRELLKSNEKSLLKSNLLDKNVLNYIEQNKIYMQ